MSNTGMGGRVLCEISCGRLSGGGVSDVSKKNFEVLTSYNWVNESRPTIFVPGSPPVWTPKPLGTQVAKDQGLTMIDQNAYRNPQYPLEPLFRAIFTQKPDFKLGDIDLITDRNNLRKLLRFVNGERYKPFRIGAQRVGKTTLFTRTEDETSEFVTGFHGYGHEFEKAYTTWPPGLESSTGHNRVVRYDIGGVRFMVRFELDATTYVDHGPSRSTGESTDVCNSSTFGVIKRGTLVPQSTILEIKTRALSRELDLTDVLPQLWFSDTLSLTAAYHRSGRFNDIRTTRMDGGILEEWERSNAEGLGKLVELIKVIIREVGEAGGEYCMIHGDGDGMLTIRGVPRKGSLPGDLKSRVVSM